MPPQQPAHLQPQSPSAPSPLAWWRIAGAGAVLGIGLTIYLVFFWRSGDARALMERGEAKLEAGNYAGAIADFDEAARVAPDLQAVQVCRTRAIAWRDRTAQADGYFNSGAARFQNNQHETAIEDFNRALELYAPGSFRAALTLNNRGSAHSRKKQPNLNAAMRDYREAIQILTALYGRWETYSPIADPDDAGRLVTVLAQTHNNRGKAHRDKSEFDVALADYNRALALQPNVSEFYANRALAKYKRERVGDLKSGLADCAKALALNADDSEAYLIRGLIRVRYNLVDDAVADFNRFVELRPAEHQRMEDLKLDAMERPRLDAKELDAP